jgi:hypothetical protein
MNMFNKKVYLRYLINNYNSESIIINIFNNISITFIKRRLFEYIIQYQTSKCSCFCYFTLNCDFHSILQMKLEDKNHGIEI